MWTPYSASVGSDDITPEEKLRRLAYCMKLLPSPLYKIERLMPTNATAQRRYLPAYEEEQPRPSMEENEEKERARLIREMCKDLDEEKESKEEKKKEKIKIKINTGTGSTRRSRIRQRNIRHHVNQYMRGKRNIMWTILLGPLGR